jgi:hypothetical protein
MCTFFFWRRSHSFESWRYSKEDEDYMHSWAFLLECRRWSPVISVCILAISYVVTFVLTLFRPWTTHRYGNECRSLQLFSRWSRDTWGMLGATSRGGRTAPRLSCRGHAWHERYRLLRLSYFFPFFFFFFFDLYVNESTITVLSYYQ